MAEIRLTALRPKSMDERSASTSVTLVSAQTGTGATDHVDLAGYVSKAIVTVVNGATNTCDVKVQGSHDASTWADIAHTAVEGSTRDAAPKSTAEQVAAGATAFLCLIPGEWPRYVRANVTGANANGVSIYLFAER